MSPKTKLLLNIFAITALSIAIAFVYKEGLAWTSPTINPPGGSGVFKAVGGDIGIGISSPTQKLDVSGYVKGTGFCIGSDCITTWSNTGVSGSGTASYLARWTSSSALGNSSVYDDGSRIAIGTASPDSNYRITTSGGGIKAENSSASQPAGYFNNTGGGAGLVIQGGNVGIGTTMPNTRLEIVDSSDRPRLRFKRTTSTKGNGVIEFAGSNDVVGWAMGPNVASAEGLEFMEGPLFTTRMYIAPGGNVGIGTTSPTEKLEVNGNIKLGGNSNKIYVSGDPNTAVVIEAAGRRLLWMDGGPMPETMFFVRNGHDFSINDDQTNATHFAVNNGNVGIGTSNPSTGLKLDVEGKVGATEYCDNNGANCKAITAMGGGATNNHTDCYWASTVGNSIQVYVPAGYHIAGIQNNGGGIVNGLYYCRY